jgi:hypothetical protein
MLTIENHLDATAPIIKPGYLASSARVNDLDLMRIAPNIFFEARKQSFTSPSSTNATPADIVEVVSEMYGPLMRDKVRSVGTMAHKPRQLINVTSLESSDDLITIFHEAGHLEDATLTDEYYRAIQRLMTKSTEFQTEDLLNAYAQLGGKAAVVKERYVTPSLFDDLVHVVTWERNANTHGLHLIRSLNKPHRLFPSDVDLHRVKKTMQVQLLGYANFNKGALNPYLTKDQKRTLDLLTEVQ